MIGRKVGSPFIFFDRSAKKVVPMRRAATSKIASEVVVHRPSCVDPPPFELVAWVLLERGNLAADEIDVLML